MGKVYLVSKNNKKYAMKIEYISSKKDSILLNELKLIKEVASYVINHLKLNKL